MAMHPSLRQFRSIPLAGIREIYNGAVGPCYISRNSQMRSTARMETFSALAACS